jgi:AMMECR1 domain-containing protein
VIVRLARRLRSLEALGVRRPAPAVEPPPRLDASDQATLLRLARGATAHHLGLPIPPGTSAPSATLLERTDPVFVTFWVDGRMRGCQGASGGSLVRNVLAAVERTTEDARAGRVGHGDLDRLRVEVDVLGAPRPFRARRLSHFERALEPGIDGVIAQRDGHRALFRTSVAITRNWPVAELVPRLCEKGGWAPESYRRRGLAFSRFRSTAFIEAAETAGAHELVRANVPVGPADWSPERIARAIEDGADYLLRAQRPDGGFVYEYAPATAAYSTQDNLVRQVATAWVVAALGSRRGTARHGEAVARALTFIAARTRRAASDGAALVVADDPDTAELGAVAFGLLTLVTAGDGALRGTAARLAEAILSLQRPDGGFHTHFPPATQPKSENFFPGEAMLALMHLHARYPDPRYPEALRRALPHYRAYFRRVRSTAFAPWQMAAYSRLFQLARDRACAEFVFEMADALLPLQFVGGTAPYPDYVGGYAGRRAPGITTATCNEGVVDAYDLARAIGDRERAARYHRAALLAALFTLRLQFTPENTYYVQHPERVLGAFRASLVDSILRIDHTQHALNSLLKVERCLLAPPMGRASRLGTDLLSTTRTGVREDPACSGGS